MYPGMKYQRQQDGGGGGAAAAAAAASSKSSLSCSFLPSSSSRSLISLSFPEWLLRCGIVVVSVGAICLLSSETMISRYASADTVQNRTITSTGHAAAAIHYIPTQQQQQDPTTMRHHVHPRGGVKLLHVFSPYVPPPQQNDDNDNNNNNNNNSNKKKKKDNYHLFAPLDQTQSITLESMKRAYQWHSELSTTSSAAGKNEVLIVAAMFPSDQDVLEPYLTLDHPTTRKKFRFKHQHPNVWGHTFLLNRSTATVFPHLQPPKSLPFVNDILQGGMEYAKHSNFDFDYLIYTNADIALQKTFYQHVTHIIQQSQQDEATRLDSFRINRKTIPRTYPNCLKQEQQRGSAKDGLGRQLVSDASFYSRSSATLFSNASFVFPCQHKQQQESTNNSNSTTNNNNDNNNNNDDDDDDDDYSYFTKHDLDWMESIYLNTPGRYAHHPGSDCFVISNEVIHSFTMGNFYLGQPPWARNFNPILQSLSRRYEIIYSNQSTTYHLGDEQSWQRDAAANGNEAEKGNTNHDKDIDKNKTKKAPFQNAGQESKNRTVQGGNTNKNGHDTFSSSSNTTTITTTTTTTSTISSKIVPCRSNVGRSGTRPIKGRRLDLGAKYHKHRPVSKHHKKRRPLPTTSKKVPKQSTSLKTTSNGNSSSGSSGSSGSNGSNGSNGSSGSSNTSNTSNTSNSTRQRQGDTVVPDEHCQEIEQLGPSSHVHNHHQHNQQQQQHQTLPNGSKAANKKDWNAPAATDADNVLANTINKKNNPYSNSTTTTSFGKNQTRIRIPPPRNFTEELKDFNLTMEELETLQQCGDLNIRRYGWTMYWVQNTINCGLLFRPKEKRGGGDAGSSSSSSGSNNHGMNSSIPSYVLPNGEALYLEVQQLQRKRQEELEKQQDENENDAD